MSFFGQQSNNQQPASGFGGFGSNNNNATSGRLHISLTPCRLSPFFVEVLSSLRI